MENELFSEVNAYITGSIDNNLVVIEGKPLESISMEEAERAVWTELEQLRDQPIPEAELQKVKNKTESLTVFAQMSILEKAMNLAYYELLGDADALNREQEKYQRVAATDIQRVAATIFRPENSSTLLYRRKDHAQ